MDRRSLLKNMAASGLLLFAGTGVSLARHPSLAEPDIATALNAKTEAEALAILFPGMTARPDGQARLTAPYLTTPDMPVTVRVDCDRTAVSAVAITATTARCPLVSLAMLHGTSGTFGTRIRLGRTSPVKAYVLAGNRLFVTAQTVKVTRGGYGTTID